MKKYLALIALILLTGCSHQAPRTEPPAAPIKAVWPEPTPKPAAKPSYSAEGLASFYGNNHHGQRTASGEKLNNQELTAAHRELPFGTHVKVTNLKNQREVVVRINDRGPFSKGRIIDLSQAAAKELDMIRAGVAPVLVESLMLEPSEP